MELVERTNVATRMRERTSGHEVAPHEPLDASDA
jgi:hypothetical protein